MRLISGKCESPTATSAEILKKQSTGKIPGQSSGQNNLHLFLIAGAATVDCDTTTGSRIRETTNGSGISTSWHDAATVNRFLKPDQPVLLGRVV
jgi:hypothetical protein